MSDLHKAAVAALDAIESGQSFDYLEEVIAPTLREVLNRQYTHAQGCWSWGPAHYMCCYEEVGRLRKWSK